MVRINIILLIMIVLMSVNNILWQFKQHTNFKKLQKLYTEHAYLVSINKNYLSYYEEAHSLLEIEQYAKENLQMFFPKKIKPL